MKNLLSNLLLLSLIVLASCDNNKRGDDIYSFDINLQSTPQSDSFTEGILAAKWSASDIVYLFEENKGTFTGKVYQYKIDPSSITNNNQQATFKFVASNDGSLPIARELDYKLLYAQTNYTNLSSLVRSGQINVQLPFCTNNSNQGFNQGVVMFSTNTFSAPKSGELRFNPTLKSLASVWEMEITSSSDLDFLLVNFEFTNSDNTSGVVSEAKVSANGSITPQKTRSRASVVLDNIKLNNGAVRLRIPLYIYSDKSIVSAKVVVLANNGNNASSIITTNLPQYQEHVIIPSANPISFLPPLATSYESQVYDYDANEYEVVKIDNKLWIKSNLRVKKYNDGSEIFFTTDNTQWIKNKNSGEYTVPVDDDYFSFYDDNYAYLYNFQAVASSKGFAGLQMVPMPGLQYLDSRWRVPSKTDWDAITKFNADALKDGSVAAWASKPETANMTRFSAFPAGYCATNGVASSLKRTAKFWSKSSMTSDNAYNFVIERDTSLVYTQATEKAFGYSVRAVRSVE